MKMVLSLCPAPEMLNNVAAVERCLRARRKKHVNVSVNVNVNVKLTKERLGVGGDVAVLPECQQG